MHAGVQGWARNQIYKKRRRIGIVIVFFSFSLSLSHIMKVDSLPSKTLFDLPKKDNRHHWIPSIFNDDSTEKDEETGDAFYQTQSSWVMVFRSGMKPFGKKKWPVVTTYILLAVMFMILSGELLLSQQTSSKCHFGKSIVILIVAR